MRADLVRELNLLRSRAARGSRSCRVSLQHLAAASGIPRSTLHTYLRGTRLPPPDSLDAIVLALGASHSEVREWAEALYRVLTPGQPDAAPTTSGTVPRQLPAAPALVGRDAELAALDDAEEAAECGPLLAVTGPGGVGKSALVARWAHRNAARFPDGQIWLDLRAFGLQPPMPPAEAIERLLRSLGANTADLPSDVDDRAAKFRSVLAGRRLILVLDNARDSTQVRDLLPGGTGCCTVVTSRAELRSLVAVHGARRIRMARLDAASSRALLVSGQPASTVPYQVLDRIARLCDGLPLALRIAGERLSLLGSAGIDRYVDELADSGRRLSALALPDVSIRAALQSSYRELPPAERELLGWLPLLHSRTVEVAPVAALCGTDESSARGRCETLAAANLLDRTDTDAYEVHDLVVHFAAEILRGWEQQEATAAGLRLLRYRTAQADRALSVLEETNFSMPPLPPGLPAVGAFASADAALTWAADTAPAVADACATELAGATPTVVWSLLPRMFWALLKRADVGVLLPVVADAAARAARDGLAAEEASLRRILGIGAGLAGRWTAAERDFRRARRLYHAIADARGEVAVLGNLALGAAFRGHIAQATAFNEQALALSRSVGESPSWKMLSTMGAAYYKAGDFEASAAMVEQARAAIERSPDRRGLQNVTCSLALLAFERGRLTDAVRLADVAVAEAEKRADRQCRGCAERILAAAYCSRGWLAEARAHLARAVDLDVGEQTLLSVNVLITQGRIEHASGNDSAALGCLRLAVDRARRLRQPYEEASAHLYRALALADHDRPAAGEAVHACLRIAGRHGFGALTRRGRRVLADHQVLAEHLPTPRRASGSVARR